MRFGSVCSGIEAASVAWHPLGWLAAWVAEVDKAASEVLAYRFPDVPNLGDLTLIAEKVLRREVEAPDVLVGGTPCQSFSIAGLRGGLSDGRGQLTLAFVLLANAIDTIRKEDGLESVIIVWENVPGVLNHKDNPLGCFLAGLAGESDPLEPPGGRWANAGLVCGPQRAAAWRTLDAQWFGLAQRRRRVFVVASAREGFDPAEILLEFDGVRRDSAPSREAGQSAAGTLDARTRGGGFPGTDGACSGHVVPADPDRVSGPPDRGSKPQPGANSQSAGCAERIRHAAGLSDTVGALDTECGFQKATMQSVNAGHVVTGIAVEPQEPVPPLWDGRDVSQTLDAVLHKGQTMPEKNRFPAVLQPVTAFSSKDYGADATSDLAPTLRASGHADSHANGGSPPAVCYGITTEQTPKFNDDCALTLTRQSPSGGGQPQAVAYAIQERATAQNAASGPNGVGVRSDDAAYTLEARPVPQSVAYSVAQRGRDGGATAELGGDVAAALRASGGGGDKPHVLAASDVLPFDTTQITSPNNYSKPKAGDTGHPLASGAHPAAVCVTDPVTHTLKAEGFDASEDGTGRGQPIVCHGTQDPCVNEAGLAFAMGRNSGGENVVLAGQRVTMAVRRLMPVECERLQGFPDFWTLVPTGKHLKPAADGPRYKQLGNSMPTPVMFWIGSRIDRMVRGIGHNGGPALDDFAELLG